MENKILQAINSVGYTGPTSQWSISDPSAFKQCIEEGPKNVEYTAFVHFLTNELRSLCNIDEEVNVITAPEDSVSFMMELSSFLKELGCPHECLTQGHISDRLNTIEDKQLVLDYLMTEMMAARILQEKKPDKKIELKLKETSQAASMKLMLITLRFPKPPANISVQALFQKLNPTVLNLVNKAGEALLGRPICNFMINDKQWKVLQTVQEDLHSEYKIRREMLLKRLDCTIQSFQWSDKMRGKDELIDRTYSDKRKQLKVEPAVDMSDFLCARQDLAIIEKTSNASVRKNTQTAINKVIIGKVPDRGGRTSEQAPPPPEMPSWQQRQPGPSGGGRGGGGRGRGDGGRGRGDGGRGRDDFGNRGGFSSRGGYDNSGGYGGGGNSFNKGNDYSAQNNSGSYGGGSDFNRNQRGGYSSSNTTSGYGSNYKKSAPVTYGGTVGNYLQSTYGAGNNQQSTYGGGSDNRGGQSSYSRGGGNRNSAGGNQSFDSAGSYSTSYGSGGGKDNKSYDNSARGRDSSGSIDYQNEPKRPKTFDSFQNNKTTHADQYVQESQQNRQYQPRDNRGRGRGRSNYSRGGGGGY